MNDSWLKTPRPTIYRWPKTLHCSDFIKEVNDSITLLNKVKGLLGSNIYHEWLYQYIHVIRKNKEKQISDALCDQLIKVLTTLKFYMTSYLVYVAPSMRHFPSLSTKGDRR